MVNDAQASSERAFGFWANALFLMGNLIVLLGITWSCYVVGALHHVMHDAKGDVAADIVQRLQFISKTSAFVTLTFGASALPLAIMGFCLLRRRLSSALALFYATACIVLIMAGFIPFLS